MKASVFRFTFASVSWTGVMEKPEEMYFVIRFFNFPEFKTDRIGVMGGKSVTEEQTHQQLVRLHQYNYGNEDPTPTYTFVVDPSEYRSPKLLQSDLTEYLVHNSCIVDIFDGRTHIYLGQINIKLAELLRGNRNQSLIAKEYNLIKIKTKELLGGIQVLVRNEEGQCKK